MILTALSPAKINLYLDVTGIRNNGYHNIKSIMQTVDLCDVITVKTLKPSSCKPQLRLTCSDPAVPLGESNIAWKAAISFFRAADIKSYNCHIHIEKHIPMEAGLAGGSTDAAAVLRLLNMSFDRPFDTDALCAVGANLGADVPFCLVGGTYLCEGIGEILTPLPPIPDCYITVARGGEGVSTPSAYRLIDKKRNCDFTDSDGDYNKLSSALHLGDINGIASSMFNIFEDVILPTHSIASRLKEIMLYHGAVGAMMSGSGPSVFGIFTSKNTAEDAAKAAGEIAKAFVCSPVKGNEI